ncbi:hypothetical protein Tco_0270970 [Tanacetum coccineum]
MENSKRGNIPMQEKPNLSKAQGANTPKEVKHMQRVPYASAIGIIINEMRVTCYTHVKFQTDEDDTKSQSRYVFVLNESEYIAASEASMEGVWMRKFIDELGSIVPTNKGPMEMLCNNTGTIAISNDPGIMKEARHYQRKYHYIREVIENGHIFLNKVHTYDNVAGPFANPMSLTKHTQHVLRIGFRRASSLM